jgi:hypothetical protein
MANPDTIRFILLIASFIFLLGVFKRPFFGVISYLIIMMTRPGLFYPVLGELRIELIVGILIIIVMLLNYGRVERVRIWGNPISKRMFLLYGVMVISMVQAFDFKTSWDWMIEFSKIFILFLMIGTLVDTQRDVKVLLWCFAIITSLFAYEAVYNYMHGIIVEKSGSDQIEYAVTSAGFGAGHVSLANMILQGMPFIWFMGVCNRVRLLKLGGAILFLLCTYGLVVSGSRGGFIGLGVLLLCLTILSKHKLLMVGLGSLFILCLPIVAGSDYMGYIDRMMGFGILDTDLSASSRIGGLINGVEMLIKRPLLGVGPGCYPLARKAWFSWGLWAHNHYGELMGELGLIGIWAWFGFLVAYLKKAVELRRSDLESESGIIAAVIVSTVVRLVLGMGTHSVYIFFWYMVAGVVAVLTRIDSELQKQEQP